MACGSPPGAPGVQKSRSTASGRPAASSASPASSRSSAGSRLREADARSGSDQPREVLLEPERDAVVDAQGLERGAAPREALVVRPDRGLARVDEPATGDGDREGPALMRRRSAARWARVARGSRGRASSAGPPRCAPVVRSVAGPRPTAAWSGAPIAASSGSAFVSDSATSAAGSESHTTPPPTQRWTAPVGDRERPDRQRELEVAVAVHAPERAHRRAATDRLERRDRVDRGDLRRAGDRAAGEGRLEQVGEPDAGAQASLDERDHVLDARERLRGHQLRPPHASRRGRRARGRCARGRRSSRARRRPSRSRGARRPSRPGACP